MADDQRLNDQMDQLLNHPALRMQRSVVAMLCFNLLRGFGVWIGVRFGGNYSGLCHCSNPCADRIHSNPGRLGHTIDRTD